MRPENIFIGPMLRYCDPFLVTICLATLHPLPLRFSVRQLDKDEWLAHDDRPLHIAVSKNLHFYFARIQPQRNQTFPQRTLLSYSIAVLKEEMLESPPDQDDSDLPSKNPADKPTSDSNSDSNPAISGNAPPEEDDAEAPPSYPDHYWDYRPFEIVVAEDGLAYEDVTLPTFFLQEKDQKLNLIYGSCRKFHDDDPKKGGAYDALALGDELIAKHFNDLNHRPAIVCLGGDQIYADDVHADTMKDVLSWATFFEEEKKESLPDSLSVPPAGERQEFLKEHAAFSSTEAENHLITFAEYLALYGLAWNPRNWSDTHSDLASYRRDLPAVRRLLANIPSYMMFDDHDVTDDWNISIDWKNGVEKSALGKRIIGNALMAYWLCQGYGNAPKLWLTVKSVQRRLDFYRDQDHARELGLQIQERHSDRATYSFAVSTFVELGQKNRWEFSTPTNPFVYFLDLRTQRDFVDGNQPKPRNGGTPAFLKSVAGWQMTVKTIDHLLNVKKPKLLILVSATPVIGYSVIEAGQESVGKVDSEILDNENWGNPKHLLHFLESMLDSNVVVLSGDVHYSFSSVARYVKFDDEPLRQAISKNKFLKRPPNTSSASPSYREVFQTQILNLTSSGLMNYASPALEVASSLDALNLAMFNGIALKNDVFFRDGTVLKGNVVDDVVVVKNPFFLPGRFLDFGIMGILTSGLPKPGLPMVLLKIVAKPRGMLIKETSRFTCTPYLGSHNLGVASFSGTTVTNYFLTYSGKKHEMRWDFDELRRR